MKPINKNSNKKASQLNVADILCSTGYLPPRNEQDLECFERIYKGREFLKALNIIDAEAIFDRVAGENKVQTMRVRSMGTIFDCPAALRVAQNTSESQDDIVVESLNQLIKDKQD